MRRIFSNKKAQVGTTITWIFATIVIISILGITFFVAGFSLSSSKDIGQTRQADILASKSFFSYLLTDDVYIQLKNESNLNEINGELAVNIFEEFYGEEYLRVWVGIVLDRRLAPYTANDFFGIRPVQTRGGDVSFGKRSIPLIKERVRLNENKFLELVLKIKS